MPDVTLNHIYSTST